jgi:hypothetical protein
MRTSLLSSVAFVAVATLAFSPTGQAKDKTRKPPSKDPQDTIEVVGHIPASGGPVVRFLSTQHYSSHYLYVEHEGGKDVTLIDVSKTAQPVVLADMPAAPGGGSVGLFVVTGTAALTTEQTATAPVAAPQTIRIMDFSDPKQPKVAHEFAGVTAMSRDDSRGLIFLANPDGIWILHQNFAEDPKVQEEYMRRIWYDR